MRKACFACYQRINDLVIIKRRLNKRGRVSVIGCNKNRNNDPILAELVEVLEIERVIEHLIDISLNDAGLTNLEFKAENDAVQKQNNIYALAKAGNIILKNDLPVAVSIGGENPLHNGYFSNPCFARSR